MQQQGTILFFFIPIKHKYTSKISLEPGGLRYYVLTRYHQLRQLATKQLDPY